MGDHHKIEVWIGLAGVIPRGGCDLLSPDQGAFVSFLTLARSEEEYRAKLTVVLNYYGLDLFDLESVEPLSLRIDPPEEIVTSARELEQNNNPKHVRYATFYTFPRVM
jgi:hypothetical protein